MKARTGSIHQEHIEDDYLLQRLHFITEIDECLLALLPIDSLFAAENLIELFYVLLIQI